MYKFVLVKAFMNYFTIFIRRDKKEKRSQFINPTGKEAYSEFSEVWDVFTFKFGLIVACIGILLESREILMNKECIS